MTDIGPIRPHALVSGDDGAEDALNDVFHLFVKQQQLFETAFKDMNSVLEMDRPRNLWVVSEQCA